MRRENAVNCLLSVSLSLLVAGLFIYIREARLSAAEEKSRGQDTFREFMDIVESVYVEDVSREDLIHSALKGMADQLDPWSEAYTPQEWERLQRTFRGVQLGLGIRFGKLGEGIRVLRVVPGSPAEKAGLGAGDRFISIAGNSLGDAVTTDDVRFLLADAPAQVVSMRMERWNTNDVREVSVERGTFKIETVFPHHVGDDGKIGLVRMTSFNQETGEDFRLALNKIVEDQCRGLIVDLRGNGGGALAQAVRCVGAFISTDIVLTSVYRDRIREYPTEDLPVASDIPLVVLVDASTASASEVMAGALQDYKRAVILGEHTYGKGVVQDVYGLRTRKMGLKLTSARYLTPAKRDLRRRSRNPENESDRGGIIPDHTIPVTRNQARIIEVFWDRRAMPGFVAAALDQTEGALRIPEGFVDPHVSAAIDWLSGKPLGIVVAGND